MQQQTQSTEIETKAISLAGLVGGGASALTSIGSFIVSLGQAGWAVIDQGTRDRDLLVLARPVPPPAPADRDRESDGVAPDARP